MIANSVPKFYYIMLTRVDFPQAIPPVSPNILTFFIFIPKKNTITQGNKVLRSGSIDVKTVLAKTNYIIHLLH